MSRTIRSESARQDLIDIYVHIYRDNPEAAERFLAATSSAFDRLSSAPLIGHLKDYEHPRLREVRSWPIRGVANWLIFYRSIPEGLEVPRILHGARDVDTIMEEGVDPGSPPEE